MSEVRKCKPNELKVGDYFSYPGSFKIYRALTDPTEDPEFSSTYNCKSCGQIAQHKPRFTFDVTDGGKVDKMSIRLISDMECSVYNSFEGAPDIDDDSVQAVLDSTLRGIEDPRRSTIIRLAYSYRMVEDDADADDMRPVLIVWFVFDSSAKATDLHIVQDPHVRHLIKSALSPVTAIPVYCQVHIQ